MPFINLGGADDDAYWRELEIVDDDLEQPGLPLLDSDLDPLLQEGTSDEDDEMAEICPPSFKKKKYIITDSDSD